MYKYIYIVAFVWNTPTYLKDLFKTQYKRGSIIKITISKVLKLKT